MKIAIGNDHVGLEMKLHIKKYLEDKGYEVIDFGTYTADRTDYPVYGEKAPLAGAAAYARANCRRKPEFSASIMCADMLNLEKDILMQI